MQQSVTGRSRFAVKCEPAFIKVHSHKMQSVVQSSEKENILSLHTCSGLLQSAVSVNEPLPTCASSY